VNAKSKNKEERGEIERHEVEGKRGGRKRLNRRHRKRRRWAREKEGSRKERKKKALLSSREEASRRGPEKALSEHGLCAPHPYRIRKTDSHRKSTVSTDEKGCGEPFAPEISILIIITICLLPGHF
jgi:hypothetical protein